MRVRFIVPLRRSGGAESIDSYDTHSYARRCRRSRGVHVWHRSRVGARADRHMGVRRDDQRFMRGATAVPLADGRTLIAGGTVAGGAATDTVVIYDPLRIRFCLPAS